MLLVGRRMASQVIENTFVNKDYQTMSNPKARVGLGKKYRDSEFMKMLAEDFRKKLNITD